MMIDTYLISSWSDLLESDLVKKAIRTLKQNTQMMSGDDSGLENIWEEICVQTQDEESFYWDIYIANTESIIEGFLSQLSRPEQTALWLNTSDGFGWWDGNDKVDDAYEEVPIVIDDIVSMILEDLLSRASDEDNENISLYFGRDYDDEEYEDE